MKIRPFSIEDLELMSVWLNNKHVKVFFGDPDEWLDEIKENLTEQEWIKYFIVETDKPIGFAQYYDTQNAPTGTWSNEPPGTAGIDFLIGEPDYLGKGLGSKLIFNVIELLRATRKYKFIIADPDIKNKNSIRTLENNGFKKQANDIFRLRI